MFEIIMYVFAFIVVSALIVAWGQAIKLGIIHIYNQIVVNKPQYEK